MRMLFFHRLWECIRVFFGLLYVQLQVVYGTWKVTGLYEPIVTIFGGSRLTPDDPFSKQAHTLAAMLVDNGISVLTGGGKGIMQAASCGALSEYEGKARTMGIGVKDLGEGANPCVQEFFTVRYFFARKWLLTRHSSAFVVFPGGWGTLDELSEVITLIDTKHHPRMPIILVGIEYWQPFMDWVTNEAIQHGLITQEQISLFTVTDDLHNALCIIRDECKIPERK